MPNSHFDTTKDSKEIIKSVNSLCSNVFKESFKNYTTWEDKEEVIKMVTKSDKGWERVAQYSKVIHCDFFCCFVFEWVSLHARLNSRYEAWRYKKEEKNRFKGKGKLKRHVNPHPPPHKN